MQPDIIDETHQPLVSSKAPLWLRIKTEWKTIAILGAPILVGQLATMANGVVDTIMAGRASAEDLTGVAIGGSLWFPLFLFFMGVLNASQPLISGHRGANEPKKIVPVAWTAIYVGLASALITALLVHNVEPVLSLMQLDEKSAYIASHYLAALSLGFPAIFILVALRGFTDGLGHTKVFMGFSIFTAVLNAPLNYMFIYGKWGAPELGGIGCGYATAISQWVTLVLFIAYLNRGKTFTQFHLWQNRMWPRKADTLQLLKLGIPIGFTIFVESVMFAIIALLLAPFGPVIVAGHQIAINIVSVLFMVPLSIGMALTLRISFLIGAQQVANANLVARSSLIFVVGIAILYVGILMAFDRTIAGFYSTDVEVIAMAVLLLGYGAVFQFADVIQVNCISALRGFKDTKIPMYIMLASFWVIGIPLGYVLATTDWIKPAMGAEGYWVGLIAGLSHAAFWLTLRLFKFSRAV